MCVTGGVPKAEKREDSLSSRWIDLLRKKRWALFLLDPFLSIAILLCALEESKSLNGSLHRYTECLSPPSQIRLFKRGGTAVEFYEITADRLSEVSSQMRLFGPLDDDNIRRDALLSWSIIWRWNGEARHSPLPLRVRATTRLILPRWCPSVSPSNEEKSEWHRYLLHVLEHEAGHLNIFLRYIQTFESTLSSVGSSCDHCAIDDLNQRGKELISRLNEQQILYDKETSHGATQFARIVPVKEN